MIYVVKLVIRNMIKVLQRARPGTEPHTGARTGSATVVGIDPSDRKGLLRDITEGYGEIMAVRIADEDLARNSYRVTESAESRSAEIVLCTRCGHPSHGSGSGRCAFLLPGRGENEEQPMCPCGHCEADDYNDLQTYLEGGREEAQAAARRLDQRAVDAGQLSPGVYREAHGDLPPIMFNAHQFWCGRRDHYFLECPYWGDE